MMLRFTMALLPLLPLLQSVAQSPASGSVSPDIANMASAYVPIESWIYPAFDRLASAGYVQTAFVGLRPWTRMDCARLIAEAQEQQIDRGNDASSSQVLRELSIEFAAELRRRDSEKNREARVESITLRSTAIAGSPLADGYHTAQTITNNYGRPYGQGQNTYAGTSLRAAYGPFAGYVHAEMQQAASLPSISQSANNAIALADFTPTAAAGPHAGFTRPRVLQAYVSFTHRNNQFTFGKQSLWWGPGKGGPLLFSNNAEPVTMLRYDRVRPFEIPGIGHWLGPIRIQAFVGRLSGHQFLHAGSQTFGQSGVALGNQPFLHGQKISFKPTPNFEFSVSRTAVFAGAGTGFTTRSFIRSIFSGGNSDGKNDPGDRRSAVDVQYRIPKLRNWLTAYVDTFTDDEPFPLNYPTESAWSPGLYLSHLPRLPKLDLRAEGYLTPHRDLFPGFYYFNVRYLSGYTNNRQLLGNWIGRESNGFQLWSTWWISPRSSLQFSARHQNASAEFLRGGNLRDLAITADLALSADWRLSVTAQDERWRFPLLSSSAMHNVVSTIQLSYRPQGRNP